MTLATPDDPDSWWIGLAYDPLPIGGIAVALMLGSYALLQLSPSLPLLLAGFCGAVLVYGADRAAVPSPEDTLNHPRRRRWLREHRTWLLGEAGVLLVVGGWALTDLRPETLYAAVGLAGLVGLHLVPMGGWGRPLKSLGLGKPLIVAGAWATGATLVPVLEAGRAVDVEVWALAGYRLLFILPNVLMADWGDRRGDVASGTNPWTKDQTGRRLRWTASGLLGLCLGSALLMSLGAPLPVLFWVDAVGPLLLLGAVWTLSPRRPEARLVMDVLVGWPLVTALVAWGLGGLG